jgi:hypothetical protein
MSQLTYDNHPDKLQLLRWGVAARTMRDEQSTYRIIIPAVQGNFLRETIMPVWHGGLFIQWEMLWDF